MTIKKSPTPLSIRCKYCDHNDKCAMVIIKEKWKKLQK